MMRVFSKQSFTASLALASAFAFFGCDNGGDGGLGDSSSSVGGGNMESVQIGSQVWMKKNLDIEAAGSKCYDNLPANCAKYGRLYDWETAKTVCPGGWHLPAKAEWDILTSYIESDKGCADCAGKHLKAMSGWNNGNGLDTYKFTALSGGHGNSDGSFEDAGDAGYWHSATERDDDRAYSWAMDYGEATFWLYRSKTFLFSVRCIKD